MVSLPQGPYGRTGKKVGLLGSSYLYMVELPGMIHGTSTKKNLSY